MFQNLQKFNYFINERNRDMNRLKNNLVLFTLISVIVFMYCSENNPAAPNLPGLPRSLSKSEADLISSDNKFGFKLFNEIVNYDKDKNVFISPLSVGLALGMTYNGARSETQEAMQTTLELHDMNLLEVNEAYKSLIELFINLDPEVQFQIANSIWYLEGFTVEQEFIDLNKNYFNAEVTSMDFSAPGAVDIINSWVNEKTMGKIEEIIDRIDPSAVMFLINALYFKATWTYEFDPENTKDEVFKLEDGTQKPCKLMVLDGNFNCYQDENLLAMELPYGVGDYSMTIILPQHGIAIDDVIGSFNQENWDHWNSQFTEKAAQVHLPKFKLEYELELKEVLTALGMGVAFHGGADFTGINSDAALYISRVLHKTFIDVNEEGTEAAAVTVVEMRDFSSYNMRVDRPFAFIISEKNSGTILFMGKVMDPILE